MHGRPHNTQTGPSHRKYKFLVFRFLHSGQFEKHLFCCVCDSGGHGEISHDSRRRHWGNELRAEKVLDNVMRHRMREKITLPELAAELLQT